GHSIGPGVGDVRWIYDRRRWQVVAAADDAHRGHICQLGLPKVVLHIAADVDAVAALREWRGPWHVDVQPRVLRAVVAHVIGVHLDEHTCVVDRTGDDDVGDAHVGADGNRAVLDV